MDILALIVAELGAGLGPPEQTVRSLLRLTVAALCGAIIGLEREREGKSAGLRTHMLVATGTSLLVVAITEAGANSSDLSRVVQGLVTGIGFLGAGAILKRTSTSDIRGLTTAAGIWMTCAIGVSAGLGRFGVALFGTVFAWVVLSILQHLEDSNGKKARPPHDSCGPPEGHPPDTDAGA